MKEWKLLKGISAKEADLKCPEIESLSQDYKECGIWAFGVEGDYWTTTEKAREKWIELHPGLPIPRILKSEHILPTEMLAICLLLDIYPLFLEYKYKFF